MTQADGKQVDFDLHGIVGIRLLNARDHEIKVVIRQLGPIQQTLSREPDIIIQFVDTLQLSSHIRLLGVDDCGFTDDAFLILRGKQKTHVRVQIPFQDIGQKQCTIVAERGLNAIPLLIAIVNLVMVSKDVLPLHASAFEYNDTGIMVTGWAKSGKSETLLAFAANGARYVGDEWIYLSKGGESMYGIPEPVRLWKWHFEEMPQYWKFVKSRDRFRLNSLKWITSLIDSISDGGFIARTAPAKILARLNPILKRQLNVQIPPKHLFNDETAGTVVSQPQKIFYLASHDMPDFTVNKATAQEIADRMVFSLEFERDTLMAHYIRFRFAFPQLRNELIETLQEREHGLLLKALENKETYTFYHPYPISIPKIFDTLKPYLQNS